MVLNHKSEKSIDVLLVCEGVMTPSHVQNLRIKGIGTVLNKKNLTSMIFPYTDDFPKFLQRESRLIQILRRIYAFPNIYSVLLQQRIKNVIVRDPQIGILVLLLAKIFNIRTFYDFHGLLYEEELYKGQKWKAFFYGLPEFICLRNYDHIISQTKSNLKISRNYNKSALIIENGISLDDFNKSDTNFLSDRFKIKSKYPIVGFIGNWESWMRIEDLLEASKILKSAKVMIVGRGNNFTSFKKKYPHVIFTDRVNHKLALELLGSFTIGICPHSKDDIMLYKSAVKTFEYLAAGKPIIVSDVKGKENFLVEGVNCLLYEPENPRSLVEKTEKLLADKDLMEKLHHNNIELSKSFSWENRIQKSGLIELLS